MIDHPVRLSLPGMGDADTLVQAVQRLSMAADLSDVVDIVRSAARRLVGADGAAFVMREGDMCHYVDEDAIAPLWKGQRFPMSACISGWSMLHGETAVVPDIYADARIPADAYRPTFVKSLAMVPIRAQDPLGAIGVYWAESRVPTDDEVRLIEALANSTAIAIRTIGVQADLERRVEERTAELEAALIGLEAFSSTVAHDLRAPICAVGNLLQLTLRDPRLDAVLRERLQVAADTSKDAVGLMDGLMRLATATADRVRIEDVDLAGLARSYAADPVGLAVGEDVDWVIDGVAAARGDREMLQIAIHNLLSNAVKFTGPVARPRIEFDAVVENGVVVYRVSDNGIGFDGRAAAEMFQPFRRIHAAQGFPGHGIGLATTRRIIEKHGGRIWAEPRPGGGARFSFTLQAG